MQLTTIVIIGLARGRLKAAVKSMAFFSREWEGEK